jgi:integral membrane protein
MEPQSPRTGLAGRASRRGQEPDFPGGPNHAEAVTQRRAQLRRLEFASVIEGTTLILLAGVAVPLKHLGGWPVGVQVLGPLHGLALLIYLWIAMQAVAEAGWSRSDVIRVFLVAVLPFGGFFNAAFISRKIAGLGKEPSR